MENSNNLRGGDKEIILKKWIYQLLLFFFYINLPLKKKTRIFILYTITDTKSKASKQREILILKDV